MTNKATILSCLNECILFNGRECGWKLWGSKFHYKRDQELIELRTKSGFLYCRSLFSVSVSPPLWSGGGSKGEWNGYGGWLEKKSFCALPDP